jgi:hypothetical protein
LFSVIMFITDKLVLHKYYFLASEQDPEFDNWYQYAGFFSMFIYFLMALRYYNLYKKLVVQVISYADTVLFKWVQNFLYAFLAMLILRLLFYVCSFFTVFQSLRYIGPWWEYFSFAIVFYYIAITGYANSIETKVPFKLNLLNYKPTLLLPKSTTEGMDDSYIAEKRR